MSPARVTADHNPLRDARIGFPSTITLTGLV